MKIGKWSTTAANNNSTPPDGWPEGQAPSTVNDCAREMMAAIKTTVNTLEYIDLDNTPSFLTTTTFSLGAADTANWEVGRRVKLFDTTTLYGTINSVSGTFVQVRLDSGILTTSLSSAALSITRNTNTSLPETVYQQENVIINGAMEIWQRGGSAASVTSGRYLADRFRYEGGNTAAVNLFRLERSASATFVPTLASAGTHLNNSLQVYISAVDSVIASTDFAGITYTVEGYDWRTIAHRPITLSFQVNTNKSGIYAVAIRNANSSASFVQNFTISAVNAWQRVFLSFPEAPTSPYTWDYSSGAGLHVTWTLACGSSFQATANAWTAMNAIATSSQVNFLANVGNSFMLTDVKLKAGTADTPVRRRPIAQEQALCERYYEVGESTVTFGAYSLGVEMRQSIHFHARKRGVPTTTYIAGAQTNVTTADLLNPTPTKLDHRVVSTASGPTADDGANWAADAEL